MTNFTTGSVYLQPTPYLDFNHSKVREFAEQSCAPGDNPRTKAVQLYYAVRDGIKYNPYDIQRKPETVRASSVVMKKSGYCVAKAVLLAALARGQNIPARLGFADVINHLSSPRLRELMRSDTFIYHGYTELFLDGKWVKATPAFNLSLCNRFKVKPLDFDGVNDSIFHEYDELGQKHMEYLHDHGHFADLPFDLIFDAYELQYPGIFASDNLPRDEVFIERIQSGK